MSAYSEKLSRIRRAVNARELKQMLDRQRFEFMEKLFDACHDGKIVVTEIEADFIQRIIAETDQNEPEIFSGDANICDSLQRKYGARLGSLATD